MNKIQLYLDTADIKKIIKTSNNQDVKGYTTNPSLMKKSDLILEKLLSNCFVITKSTPKLFSILFFWLMLESLKFLIFLLKYIFGIGSNVTTPISN